MQQNNDSGDGAGAEPNNLQAPDSEMAVGAQSQPDNQDGGQAAGHEGVDVGNKPVFGPSAAKILAPMMHGISRSGTSAASNVPQNFSTHV